MDTLFVRVLLETVLLAAVVLLVYSFVEYPSPPRRSLIPRSLPRMKALRDALAKQGEKALRALPMLWCYEHRCLLENVREPANRLSLSRLRPGWATNTWPKLRGPYCDMQYRGAGHPEPHNDIADYRMRMRDGSPGFDHAAGYHD